MTDQLTELNDAQPAPANPVVFPSFTYTYRLATPADELHIITAFSRMLRELEPMGYMQPTEANIDGTFELIFRPALASNRHGISLAFDENHACIGAVLAVPTTDKRAVNHGMWVEPRQRRAGIAKRLQTLAYERLHDLGFKNVLSTVIKDNVAGLRACMSADARIIGYITSTNLEGAS